MKTFLFKDVKLGSYKEQYLNPLNQFLGVEKVLVSSPIKPGLRGSKNGLMGAMEHAYSNHIPLVLRPDDLWIAIAAAFGNYVITHAEAMRSTFVSHEGKRNSLSRRAAPSLLPTGP